MAWARQSSQQIHTLRINHRNWKQATSETFAALSFAVPGEVIAITGPSRAGKTRLIETMEEMLAPPQPLLAPGIMPVVSVLATNCSVRGTFSTKSFTLRALRALNHPFFSNGEHGGNWDLNILRKLERIPEHVLRQAWEEALVARKTRYLFIDEAQHVARANSGLKEAAAILDSWKCLGQATNIVIVLVGAYPLLTVLKQSPHLLGRKTQIHLPRYRADIDDLQEFSTILLAYSEKLVLPRSVPSLRQWEPLLYKETFGCIGLLEKWLRRALTLVHANGEEVLQKKHLLATRMAAADLKEIAKEIEAGEKHLREHMDLLPDDLDDSAEEPQHDLEPPKKEAKEKPKKKPKPFQAKPRNNPIGGRV
ncbi:AAA family ATPase [Petrachloros mirabilis]